MNKEIQPRYASRTLLALVAVILAACNHAGVSTSPSNVHQAVTATNAVIRSSRIPPNPDGPTVARQMQERYDDKSPDCSTAIRPAFLCAGVLFRGTTASTAYHSWNPNPSSKRGSVSFAWLRQDANFGSMHYTNGFVFLPKLHADEFGYRPMFVLCAFPLDGGTESRSEKGCGKRPGDTPHSRPCATQNITTAAAWLTAYRVKPYDYDNQCSFNVTYGTPDTANAFSQVYLAMASLNGELFNPPAHWNGTNELLIETWPQDIPRELPIEAFFYTGTKTGLDGARYDQKDFYGATGRWVPVIRLTLATTMCGRATFAYNPADQLIAGP